MEHLATELGQTRGALQQRLKKLHWTSDDLKNPLNLKVFRALKESPHAAIGVLIEELKDIEAESEELRGSQDDLEVQLNELESETSALTKEIASLDSSISALETAAPQNSLDKEIRELVRPSKMFQDRLERVNKALKT